MQNKKTKRQQKDEFDFKHKVIRKGTMMKLLKNSDLKGADGGDVLKAIFNAADSGDDDDESESKLDSSEASPMGGTTFAEVACVEFIHKSPKHTRLNGIDEAAEELQSGHKLETQETLVRSIDELLDADLPQEHAVDMLHEECIFYKKKSAKLTNDISNLEEEMNNLKLQLQSLQEPQARAQARSASGADEKDKSAKGATDDEEKPLLSDKDAYGDLSSWHDDVNIMNDAQVEREEELIVYKERLEQSEMSNIALRKEISELRLKQPMLQDFNLLYRRALPLGCVALAAIIYFLSIRF